MLAGMGPIYMASVSKIGHGLDFMTSKNKIKMFVYYVYSNRSCLSSEQNS